MVDDLDGAAAVSRAELILAHASLTSHEDDAVEGLRASNGVAFAPLYPEAPVIQAVTVNGWHVGRVRLLNPHRGPERWVAVPLGGRCYGCFDSAADAAAALAANAFDSDRWTL